MDAALTWALPSSCPLSGRRPLYKVPFPLGPTYLEHMPPALPQDPFVEEGLAHWLVEAEHG
jgi:hypothetical protein